MYSRSQHQQHPFTPNLPYSETLIRIIQRDEWKEEMHNSNLSMPKLTVECEVALNCALLKLKSERKVMLKFSQGHLPGIEDYDLPWNDPLMPSMASHFSLAYCAMYSKSQGKQWGAYASISTPRTRIDWSTACHQVLPYVQYFKCEHELLTHHNKTSEIVYM